MVTSCRHTVAAVALCLLFAGCSGQSDGGQQPTSARPSAPTTRSSDAVAADPEVADLMDSVVGWGLSVHGAFAEMNERWNALDDIDRTAAGASDEAFPLLDQLQADVQDLTRRQDKVLAALDEMMRLDTDWRVRTWAAKKRDAEEQRLRMFTTAGDYFATVRPTFDPAELATWSDTKLDALFSEVHSLMDQISRMMLRVSTKEKAAADYYEQNGLGTLLGP